MHIGILEMGRSSAALTQSHGSYPELLSFLLLRQSKDFTFTTYPVLEGLLPADVAQHDGWLVTGSPHGVYDGLPWIAPAEEFLRKAMTAHRPIVGICFGHQLLAQALGGTVIKSPKGWGLGLHEYTWQPMSGRSGSFVLPASHQDQVVALPPTGTVLAASSHCAYAALAYGNDALTFQAHPEFTLAYQQDSLRLKEEVGGITPDILTAAQHSLTAKVSSSLAIGAMIADFYLRPR